MLLLKVFDESLQFLVEKSFVLNLQLFCSIYVDKRGH